MYFVLWQHERLFPVCVDWLSVSCEQSQNAISYDSSLVKWCKALKIRSFSSIYTYWGDGILKNAHRLCPQQLYEPQYKNLLLPSKWFSTLFFFSWQSKENFHFMRAQLHIHRPFSVFLVVFPLLSYFFFPDPRFVFKCGEYPASAQCPKNTINI